MLAKTMKVSEARGKLRKGMRVRTNGSTHTCTDVFEGTVLCVHEGFFFVSHPSGHGIFCNDCEGSPKRSSWQIYDDNESAEIEILDPLTDVIEEPSELIDRKAATTAEPTPMELIKNLKRLTRKEPEKSFIDKGITDEEGNLTTAGRNDFVDFLWEDEATRKRFYEEVVKPVVEAEKRKEKE
jgi:hypothetical protein